MFVMSPFSMRVINLAESLILNPAMFFLSWGARVKVPLNMNLPILQLKTCIETE